MRSFNPVAVRSYDEQAESFYSLSYGGLFVQKAQDDGALYPLLSQRGEAVAGIQRESGDGKTLRLEAKGLVLREIKNTRRTDLFRLAGVDIDVLMTEARIAFSCRKWNKTRGAVGIGAGAVVAAGYNAVKRGVEAQARKKTLLVGQIRYNWLARISYGHSNWTEPRRLLLLCFDGYDKTRALALGLQMPGTVAGATLTKVVASRAGQYVQRAGIEMTDEKRQKLTSLVRDPTPADLDGKGKWSVIQMPVWEKAHHESVHLGANAEE